MTMDAAQAGAILAEVDSIVAKVRQSRLYRLTGALLVLWGAIVIAADLIGFAWPRWSVWTWAATNALGAAASFFMLRAGADVPRRMPWRFLAAFALFVAFGLLWSVGIGRFGPRELDAFWPTLFLFGYALAGLWFGAAFTALGLGLSALIVAGYFWSGEWFTLWLAAVNGGGFILCGLWMRRA
jgi:hypothetical protein